MRAVAAALVAAAALAAFPSLASGQAYRIPPDNPFVGVAGTASEIYAMGLRNPFRFSFDRATGDLFIGDVGGGEREEVNWISRAGARGANFGWPCREGLEEGPVSSPSPRCPSPAPPYVDPVHDYPRPPMGEPMAVTAGHVVRDPGLAGLVGRGLFVDFFAGDVMSVGPGGDVLSTSLSRTSIASFGEDAAGRLYFADLSEVHRLLPNGSGGLTSAALPGPFAEPISIAAVPGDPNRLLVAERAGRVRLVVNDQVQPGAVAEIPTPPGVSQGGERGLLSVTAAPDFPTTGRLYVYYTDAGGDVRVDEFTNGVRREILAIEHSSQSNHNGGQLHFGPDGYLWISTGDGGGQNDQENNAQNPATLLGKLLRIDPITPVVQPPPQPNAAPVLRARAKRRQRVRRLRGAVARAGCNEACRVTATGRLRIGRARYRMRTVRRNAQAGQRVRMKVRLTRKGRRALRRTARRGRLRRASVRLTFRATDAGGLQSATVRRTVRIRR